MKLSVAILASMIVTSIPVYASPVNLTPGDTYQITFTINTLDFPCPDVCDTMLLAPNFDLDSFSGATLEAQLFDGATLLGTSDPFICCFIAFESPASAFDFNNAGVADFSSIQDGSIQGMIEIYVTSGSIPDFDPAGGEFFVGSATGGAATSQDSQTLTVTGVNFFAPEPSSFFFGTLGCCALGLWLFRRGSIAV